MAAPKCKTLLPLQCLVVFKVVLCAIRLIPTTVFNSHDMFYCFPLVSKKTEARCRSPLEQLLLRPMGTETTCLDSGFRDPSLQGLFLSTVPTPYKSPYSSPPDGQSIPETVNQSGLDDGHITLLHWGFILSICCPIRRTGGAVSEHNYFKTSLPNLNKTCSDKSKTRLFF